MVAPEIRKPKLFALLDLSVATVLAALAVAPVVEAVLRKEY
jgi:hypothetical protein